MSGQGRTLFQVNLTHQYITTYLFTSLIYQTTYHTFLPGVLTTTDIITNIIYL
jgi:hypothetical protein